MAQNQIRKGFFFYFGLLILFLVTLALIFMVVLIFSPNKDFIGLRYFSYTNQESIKNLSDEERTEIDYKNVKIIEIDCGYADVSVKRGGENNWEDGIRIKNDAKGFTTAANAIDFTYTATFENEKLTVKFTEPTGFLYFSKNIDIIIYSNSTSNFLEDKTIIVKASDDGDIFLGGIVNVNSLNSRGFTLNTADVRTEKGSVYIENGLVLDNGKEGDEHKVVKALNLTTGSGNIGYRYNKDDVGEKNEIDIPDDCDVKLKTANGRINFNYVKGKDLTIECENGSVDINTLELSGTCKINCKQGNYKFGNVTGNLDYGIAENTMISPDIDITGILTGNFYLANSNKEAGASPNVTINKIVGNIDITSIDGGLKIKDSIKGTLTVVGSGSFFVEASVLNDNNKANVNIQLEKGNVTLNLKDTINAYNDPDKGYINLVSTETGNITLNLTSKAKFEAVTTQYNGDNRNKDDKITFSSDGAFPMNGNIITVNGGSRTDGYIKLATNESIKLNLVSNL